MLGGMVPFTRRDNRRTPPRMPKRPKHVSLPLSPDRTARSWPRRMAHGASATALLTLAGCASVSPMSWFDDPGPSLAPAPGATTFVFIRHAEKPISGLGQLNCRGLNRAIALADRLPLRVGPPQAVFAPSPASQNEDSGKSYSYVRALATVEPLAVRYTLPVNAQIGYNDPAALVAALDAPALRGQTVVIAWQHDALVTAVRDLLGRHGGPASAVPRWRGSDFDSIYIVRVPADGSGADFIQMSQGLDRLSQSCPTG